MGPTNRARFVWRWKMRLLSLDGGVYAVEAVQKAAYRLIDRCAVLIDREGDRITCKITIDQQYADISDAIVADFQKELIDQQLRLQIKEETADVRNLILALAFSKAGLQG